AVPLLASPIATPGFFSRPSDLHALPEGSVILVAPFAVVGSADAMYWQAEAAMWFRMPEGEAFVPSPYPLYPPPSATEFALVRLADGSARWRSWTRAWPARSGLTCAGGMWRPSWSALWRIG